MRIAERERFLKHLELVLLCALLSRLFLGESILLSLNAQFVCFCLALDLLSFPRIPGAAAGQ